MAGKKNKASRKIEQQQKLIKERRRRQILIIVPAVLGITLLGMFAFFRLQPVEGTLDFGAQERGHDVGSTFVNAGLPPVGGVHDPRWQNCGIYTKPIDLGPAVHSMEHGAVWITYNPDIPGDDVSDLQEMVRGNSYILLSPYPNLESSVVATAWGVQLRLDSAADHRLEDFIGRYRNGGPEPGAPCTDGLGDPIQ